MTCLVTFSAATSGGAVRANAKLVFVATGPAIRAAGGTVVPRDAIEALADASGVGSVALRPGPYVLQMVTPLGLQAVEITVPAEETADLWTLVDAVDIPLPPESLQLAQASAVSAALDRLATAADREATAATLLQAQLTLLETIAVNKETRAQLFAELDWPDGMRGAVWGDATEAYNGVYLKSGSIGAGSWARIGDLPQSPVTAAQLAEKANQADFEDAEALLVELDSKVRTIDAIDELAFAMLGSGGAATWMQARATPLAPGLRGGGPSELTIGLVIEALQHLGYHVPSARTLPGYGLIVTAPDADGARAMSPDFALDADLRYGAEELASLVTRMGDLGLLTGIEILPNGTYQGPTGDYVAAEVDMTKWMSMGSSSMQRMDATLATQSALYGATLWQGGLGSDNGPEILSRCGVTPYVVQAGVTLPADGSTVAVSVTPNPTPRSGGIGVNVDVPVTIGAGPGAVKAVLRASVDGANRVRTLRLAVPSGAPVNVATGAELWAQVRDTYRDAVLILNIGKNSVGSLTGAELAEYNLAAWRWASGVFRRVLVLGQFVNTTHAPGSFSFTSVYDWNAIEAERYGRYYVPIMEYVTGPDVWDHVGLTPDATDTAYAAAGRVPPSLMSDDQHLSNSVYEAYVINRVVPRMHALNWYEVPA